MRNLFQLNSDLQKITTVFIQYIVNSGAKKYDQADYNLPVITLNGLQFTIFNRSVVDKDQGKLSFVIPIHVNPNRCPWAQWFSTFGSLRAIKQDKVLFIDQSCKNIILFGK